MEVFLLYENMDDKVLEKLAEELTLAGIPTTTTELKESMCLDTREQLKVSIEENSFEIPENVFFEDKCKDSIFKFKENLKKTKKRSFNERAKPFTFKRHRQRS